MIEIRDKKKCCGCTACASSCPRHCISMVEDNEGFLYPKVDPINCIDCGLCERVCPFWSDRFEKKPLHSFAAKNPNDELRKLSSSGGLFTAFAERFIIEGGVVFGVQFDRDWNVVHGKALTVNELEKFRGSKYVQSSLGSSYSEAREYLQQGRKVLFSGTSCQIMGLKKYLGKDYPKLFTIDVICHGVPSPKVWRHYLKEITEIAHKGKKNQFRTLFSNIIPETDAPIKGNLTGICFRDKSYGWRKISFALSFAEASADGEKKLFRTLIQKEFQSKYHAAFNFNLTLRPSCSNCPAKGGRSGSDVTLADFWGIENVLPNFSDDKGVSLCICNTREGYDLLKSLKVISQEVEFCNAVEKNESWSVSKKPHPKRDTFFRLFAQNGKVQKNIDKCMRPPFFSRVWMRIRKIIKVILQHITK